MSNSEDPESGTDRLTRSTARNPRRRQRQSDNDTLKTSAPQRKRSKLSEDVFQPRASTEQIPTTDALQPAANEGPQTNGHHEHLPQHVTASGRHRRASSVDIEMAVRGKKPASKRAMRGDGATVLTQNKCYSARLLPSTPKELKKEGVDYRGSIDTTGHALAITHEKATVWEYNGHTAGNAKVFDLPFPSRIGEPLPFGALVASGVSNTDVGLVVISATSGKVFFYESIDRTASLGLFQDRKSSVQGDIGLYSGERVADVVPAEHAGLMVVLDSGRIAHLTLRDPQGKARVVVNFLRASDSRSGGIFGSIKGYLAGAFKKDLAAVHTRPSRTRGQMQTVSLTEGGEVVTWEVDWTGRSECKGTVEIREKLVEELKLLAIPELEGRLSNLAALDFALLDNPIAAHGLELAKLDDTADQPLHVAVLLRVGGADMYDYAVAALTLTGSHADVHQITYITKYQSKGGRTSSTRPRLVVPKPEHTVFVTFEDATVMLPARLPPTEGPEAQLVTADVPKEPYEEALYLRPSRGLVFQACFAENSKGSSHATCVAFVKNGGLVRISSADVHKIAEGPTISAKTRIENAVFFGILSDNILDFTRIIDAKHSVVDVENAALQVSDEIVRAATPYTTFISPSPTSMEQHLVSKARALQALAGHIRTSYPAIPRQTMWRLLFDAEHVAAGQELWTAFEEHVADSFDGKRKATILDEVCTWFTQDHFAQRSDLANEDPVRRFFIGGLHRLEPLLNHVKLCVAGLKQDDKPPKHILRIVIQANDLWIRSLGTAFTFRGRNASDYGILPDLLEDGVLVETTEYVDLPEFWTSVARLTENTVAIARLSRFIANRYYETGDQEAVVEQMAGELAQFNPSILQLYCQLSEESINWRASRPSQKERDYAESLREHYDSVRYSQLRSLADVGQAEAGMRLAEKYNDMNTLTDLVIAEDQYLIETAEKTPITTDRQFILNARTEIQAKILTYFERYGEAWATPFFDKMFSDGATGAKLDQAQKTWKSAVTKYLRADSRRAKLCWINDVMEASDFEHAGKALADTATEQENKLWAKKVELSMSRLALMAAEEDAATTRLANGGPVQSINPATKDLQIVEAQEKLYDHIHGTIIGSLDREAETINCMLKFGTHISDMIALRQLLENGLNMIIDHTVLSIEQLIDVLTLIDIHPDSSDDDDSIRGGEFVLALSALDAAAPSLPSNRFETLLQLIWKRCYIYDDWTQFKLSGKQSDADRTAILRGTILWSTLRQALDAHLFDSDSSRLRILAPSDCLGSACLPEDFSYRFPDEELLMPILHDCKIQDEILQSFVADRRLDEIAADCLRDAQTQMESRRAAGKKTARELQEVDVEAEKSVLENGNDHGHLNGYGDVNGYANGQYADAGADEDMF
ncbi:unnamed protein product [Zymoseptoria tritici ST99CH_3D7]|uniref:Nucleoporin Nup133/Nup155-like C-terminal domain-containing protein n=1 Tax=Zymoseptoria tritici (strain ST99CH_3D7) TaxID=1276538 RepID=A0A1X7S7B4_ZYMT9|nr:unnamed protein product [Zymoseptoria tritici ST99CH_3D7]